MTSQATQRQLYEHLALLVRYFEQETSQGDGIAEEHFDGYMAAKSLLARLAPSQPSCENAISNSTGEMTCSTCGCDESRAPAPDRSRESSSVCGRVRGRVRGRARGRAYRSHPR